jgi:hypothetical protein
MGLTMSLGLRLGIRVRHIAGVLLLPGLAYV